MRLLPRRRSSALLLAVIPAQMAYGMTRRRPAGTRALLGLMLLAAGAEAGSSRGRRGLAVLGIGGATGWAAEFVGVHTGRPFGRYAYSGQLGPRVGGVPLLAAAAWAVMARPAWVAAGWLSPARPARVLAAAGGLAAWDVFLDPRMVREGYWSWERPGRYEGIPLTNYLGWVLTGALAFGAVAVLDDGPPDRGDDRALAIYVWTWLGEGFANAVLWRERRTALAGLLAMGALAAPAIDRRLRAG